MSQIRKYGYKVFDLGKWRISIDNDVEMLECPNCECRVFMEDYFKAIGQHGIRFCPYCGTNLQEFSNQMELLDYVRLL